MTDITALTPTPLTPAPTTPLRDLALTESFADPNANDLDKDAFLQLLVAQLRYQDPLNPSDPAEFMATTAQFTVVEKLDELTQQGANTAIISGLSMASSLVGRTVTYVGGDDAIASAVVSSAQVTNGEVRLVTDNGVVDLSTVVGIGASVGGDVPVTVGAGSGTAAAAPPPPTTQLPTAPPEGSAPASSPTTPPPPTMPPPPTAPLPSTGPAPAADEPEIPEVANLPDTSLAIPTAPTATPSPAPNTPSTAPHLTTAKEFLS